MPFFTYIIRSQKNRKYYIGSTKHLETRLQEHNRSKTHSTRQGIPWKLVYHEEFITRSEAIKREFEIKRKKSRRYIDYLIQNIDHNHQKL